MLRSYESVFSAEFHSEFWNSRISGGPATRGSRLVISRPSSVTVYVPWLRSRHPFTLNADTCRINTDFSPFIPRCLVRAECSILIEFLDVIVMIIVEGIGNEVLDFVVYVIQEPRRL